MWDLKACVVCFKLEGKLYKIHSGELKNEFFLVSGIKVSCLVLENRLFPQAFSVNCVIFINLLVICMFYVFIF